MRRIVRARSSLCAAALAAAAAGASGCASALRAPDLGGLYDRAARSEGPARNPIIVVPGILGSRLRDAESGRVVWGAFAGTYADPRRADGARLVALPMAEGVPLSELRDGVVADGVLDRVRVHLLRLPFEQRAYVQLLATLGAGGYRDPGLAGAIDYGEGHFTCFQFPYDWRRDVVENARALGAFIEEKRTYVAAELERRHGVRNPEVKFDLVAHSMGGLVARWYLMYGDGEPPAGGGAAAPAWPGARRVERAVLVGTPNAGAVDALVYLVEGRSFSWLLPRFGPALLGTMPSLYELMPRARHVRVVERGSGRRVDPFDPAAWERYGWGLAAPDRDRELAILLPDAAPDVRRRIARDHLRKSLARAESVHAALDAPAAPPPGLALHLIAGDATPTPDRVEVDPESGRLEITARAPGDGTVLRASALLDERAGGAWSPRVATPIAFDHVTFLFTDHLGLTSDPAFSDNLLYLLLEEPRRRLSP